jgi:hypothetical protein
MNDGPVLGHVPDFIKATVQSVPYPVKISEDDQANIASSVPRLADHPGVVLFPSLSLHDEVLQVRASRAAIR